MDIDDDEEDQSFSEISCGPNCAAPKLLVGVVRVDHEHGKTQYVLKFSLVDTELEWTVKRRYSEFLEVRDDVYFAFLTRNVNQCFGCRWFFNSLRDFDFPRKHLVSSKDRNVIRFRKTRLDRFARLLAAHTFSAIPKCVRCSEMPFYRIRDFFTQNAQLPGHVSARDIRRTLVPERFAAIADPAKSKIEFRRGHGIFKVFQVEKPILVKWGEIEEAARAERLARRWCSSSSLASPSEVDGFDLEEEKRSLQLSTDEKEELELTGVTHTEVVATEHAVSLQPLTLRKPEKHQQTTPRVRADGSHWESWNLASPKRTAAKEA